ncbi:acyltransferase [Aliiglaciecola sp. LCG003]|uniref:acyltransferase family protein n=1 Tax=Aliiglaciecola sp. LCG003 TaxID=3053655 RepID=UPI0025723649|nr:acyltransferase [Aliiglaciecola sp. LCG003]WJG10170.1 acyltransferase [Aliiglaciecola sp. LCG003]
MERRPQLDWLRVILVFAVFLHHGLMPFNGDDWHIMNTESSKLLDDIMVFFEQLRLPSLFLIAGAGSTLLLAKKSPLNFTKDKFLRLALPLFVGILFIVPPQTYIENKPDYESFFSAFPLLMLEFKTNHLWFIEYLVVFSLLVIPMHSILNSRYGNRLNALLERYTSKPNALFSLVLVLIAIRVPLNNIFHGDGQSLGNPASVIYYWFFFVAGMIFIQSSVSWNNIRLHRATNAKWFSLSSLAFYLYYFSPDLSPYLSEFVRWSIWWLMCCLVAWSGLLTIFGFAQEYLTKRPDWLKMSNQLIYPFYIFHQTIIVVFGAYIIDTELSLAAKAITLIIASFCLTTGICVLFIRPFAPLRFLFGLKTGA